MRITDMDKQLYKLLDKYSDAPDSPRGKALEKIIASSENAEMIIPVLGMQGMGKSTLINAVLGESILPSAADETTCVPVEVKYGEEEYAEVHFTEKTDVTIIHTSDELSEYVDNNYNPGNTKKVSRIVLFRRCELLRSGMVIVDLPGVGSMTQENADTTNRYIQNLCTAIFVIPTNPTIRKIETIFIKSVWSQFSKAVFVQNDWDESRREIKEAVEFNSAALRNIARELNTPFDGKITVVNAYNALSGRLKHDDEMVESSNINSLIKQIKELADCWDSSLESDVRSRIHYFIAYAKAEIDRRIQQIDMDEQALEEQLQAEYEEYRKANREFKKKIEELKEWVLDQKASCQNALFRKAEIHVGNISAQMTHGIENGVYDGPSLTEMFRHIQENESADFGNDCFDVLMDFKFALEEKMEGLGELVPENKTLNITIQDVNLDKKFKFEQFFTPVGSVGGGVGGVFAATGIGAAIGGPVGAVVGGIVGLCCSLAGGFLGKLFQTGVEDAREQQAKKAVEPQIKEVEKAYRKCVSEKIDQMTENILNELDEMVKKGKEEENRLLERSIECEKSDNTRDELESDRDQLEEMEKKLCLQM